MAGSRFRDILDMKKPIARILSDSLFGLEFNDLPETLIQFARVTLLDWLGAAFAGSNQDSIRILMKVIPTTSPFQEATILPSKSKGLALFAALVNGAASHATEMDDFHKTSMVHLGVTVIPALLALSEKLNATGKEFIASMIAGFETGIRVGEAVNPSHWEFWHPTGTCGTFAAFAGCGRLLKLMPQEMAFGFGIAGTQSAGFRFYEGMNKHLHPGKAAMNGLLSALLAKEGFTGDEHIFEGETGFCKAMAKDWDLEKIIAKLPLSAENFRSLENSYKPYASCRHTHPAIDATMKIVKSQSLQPDQVQSIRCRTYSAATRLLSDSAARDPASAKFSLPYCIAITIKGEKAGVDSFSTSLLRDPQVRCLMEKIHVEVDPGMERLYPEKWPAEVEILTKEGERLMGRVDYPKGDPENPMSMREMIEKYEDLLRGVINESAMKRILEQSLTLEKVQDMSTFFDGCFSSGG